MRLKTGRTSSRVALRAHLGFGLAGELGETGVREAHGLQRAQLLGGRRQSVRLDARFEIDDLLHARDEPGIDLAGGVHLLVVEAQAQRLGDLEDAVRASDGRARRG